MASLDTKMAPLLADSPEPLWKQAAAAIEQEIASKAMAPGSRLPAERDLLSRFAISRVTLRRALHSLVEAGVIVSSKGRGWFVATDAPQEFPQTLESFTETARRLGFEASSTVVRVEKRPASLDEAEELGIAPGSPVFHLDRIRQLDGVPVALDCSFFPMNERMDFAEVDFKTASLFQLLTGAGCDLARAEVSIEARGADADLAGQLGIEPGMPVLSMRQLIVDGAGTPVLATTVRYAGDRYRLRTSFTRNPGPASPSAT